MDVTILLLVTACGAFGAPVLTVLIAASILTVMSAKKKVQMARAYRDVGVSRVLAVTLLLSLANNTVFTLASFALGRAAALLV